MNRSTLARGGVLHGAKDSLALMLRTLRPHARPRAVPQAGLALFPRAVSIVLLALALGGVLLWSAPAEAQTATDAQAVTATPVPAATPRPTTALTPEPTATPTPGPVPIVETLEEGGISPWIVLLPIVGLALVLGCRAYPRLWSAWRNSAR
ncbi:MAG: hypothetical protein OXE50_11930 [Chloroflexi bacterium]|nr:hypothetical protein [Chloroflexota bacterium]